MPCSGSINMWFFGEEMRQWHSIGIWRSVRSDQLFSFEPVLSATVPTDKSLTVSQQVCKLHTGYEPGPVILAGLHLRAPFVIWTKITSKVCIKKFLGDPFLGGDNALWHIQIPLALMCILRPSGNAMPWKIHKLTLDFRPLCVFEVVMVLGDWVHMCLCNLSQMNVVCAWQWTEAHAQMAEC